MSEPKLKPCPIPGCGGSPIEVNDEEEHAVYCSNTACRFRFGRSLYYEDWQSFPGPSEAAARIAGEMSTWANDARTAEGVTVAEARHVIYAFAVRLASLASPQSGVLVRADIPMCPECERELHEHDGGWCCRACDDGEFRFVDMPDYGYLAPDLGAVREVMGEMGNPTVHLLPPPAPEVIASWYARLDAALKGGQDE